MENIKNILVPLDGSKSSFKALKKAIYLSKKCGSVKSRDEGKKVMYKISNNQLSELISSVTKASKKIPNLCNESTCC